MGGKCPHRKVKKRRFSHKTARRSKFMLKGDDAVYDELVKLAEESKSKPLPLDEDLPGMGQFYCLHCDRYFASEAVMVEHNGSKRHRKRVKLMMGPAPHTQLDAELAAGMGMPDNGPKLMST
ncbi:zinc finger C2H2 protein ECU02_0310 [Asparagus officinalis]|uniref:zinc finger C2H2 protein ECU02_0310 n=1 Tax=Asparagus officinalis TaxID=4686 RepID=UPI00098E837E|nr:zinc finger C2H2 protein ECU02_0310 [Asparagus officinalis]